jgi:copper homeostasis protein CutC
MRNCTHTTHANRITKDRARLCQTRGTVGVTQSYSELASVTSSQIRNE